MRVLRMLGAGLLLGLLLVAPPAQALSVQTAAQTPAESPSWWSAVVDFVEAVVEVFLGEEEPGTESQSEPPPEAGEGGAEADPNG